MKKNINISEFETFATTSTMTSMKASLTWRELVARCLLYLYALKLVITL